MKKGQSTFSSSGLDLKKKFVRGVGLFLFLVGAYFIIVTFFGITNFLTGNVVSEEGAGGIWAIAGFVMEALGVFFMLMASRFSS